MPYHPIDLPVTQRVRCPSCGTPARLLAKLDVSNDASAYESGVKEWMALPSKPLRRKRLRRGAVAPTQTFASP
jgi:hypothetical protein